MMKKFLWGSVCAFMIGFVVSGQELSNYIDHTDKFLKTHVENGRVKYADIKKDPKGLWDALQMARTISVSKSDSSNYQAFWVNTYNLLVIKGVIENYPISSPLDVPDFFDKITFRVEGIDLTLNDIENKLLRANFPNEPRFHFVLVCAGLGCPSIKDGAYRPLLLKEQLQEQTVKALNDPNFIKVDKNKVEVSQIFEWYHGDFVKNDLSLKDFINQYRKEKLPEKAILSYYPYDWSLNDRH